MGSEWKNGFKRAVIDALVSHGGVLEERPSAFGWLDYERTQDARRVLARHGIDYDRCVYKESYWDEFMGTFYEGDTRVYGIDATIVTRRGRTFKFRWQGTVSEMIEAVLSDG